MGMVSSSAWPIDWPRGTVWPTSYAIAELSSADEKVIAELVRKAIGD